MGVYHDFEGGAIARTRQPPPGANLPYPNLADVPAARAPAAPGTQAAIAARARGGVSAPSAGALAGLSLPAAPPPVPDVPGLDIVNPAAQAAAPKPAAKPAAPRPAPAPKPPGPPVSIAFPAGSALLPYKQAQVIQGVAGQRGGAKIRVFGFGEGSLALGLARARRMADQLTAAGVPGNEIDINALAAGSGGFVQLVY
ncbi:hypothetical protein [Acidocella sp.]|uniref:hypothetical protein n=1 Tax=Acidocella sp. TaxID=50710 RepID=UPI003D000B97